MPDALFAGGTASKENGVTDNDGSLFSQLFSFVSKLFEKRSNTVVINNIS
jgi:hypothetical protein